MATLLDKLKSEKIIFQEKMFELVPADFFDQDSLFDLYLSSQESWFRNPNVIRYRWNDFIQPVKHVPKDKNELMALLSSQKRTVFIIEKDGIPIGDIGINTLILEEDYNISYMIGSPNDWGKGYGYKSASAFIKYLCEVHYDSINQLSLFISALNRRSISIGERFRREGYMDKRTFVPLRLSWFYTKSVSNH